MNYFLTVLPCPHCDKEYQGSDREVEGKMRRHIRLQHPGEQYTTLDSNPVEKKKIKGKSKSDVMKLIKKE